MTGPEFTVEVRPQVLTAYAESLHARAADLAAAGEAVAGVRVERGWFGKLPQSGFLADRYAVHRDGVLAEAGELVAWLAAATLGLAESAGRYSGADRVVAGFAEDVAAALDVGIEISEAESGSGDGQGAGAGERGGAAGAESAESGDSGDSGDSESGDEARG
jgi:hypothetical protein